MVNDISMELEIVSCTVYFACLLFVLALISYWFAGVTALQVLFDANSCIKRYTNVDEILREFYDLRLKYYVKRKDYMEGMLGAESLKLANQARFICEKIEGRIAIGIAMLLFLWYLTVMSCIEIWN